MLLARRIALLVALLLFVFALFEFTPIDCFSAVQEVALGGVILAVLGLVP